MMEQNYINFSIETPGKVILHGEHSVVYGKTAVAASIDMKTRLKFTNDVNVVAPSITLELTCLNWRHEFYLQELNEIVMHPIPLRGGRLLDSFNIGSPDTIDFEPFLKTIKSFVLQKVVIPSKPIENAVLSFLCVFVGMLSSVNVFVESFEILVCSDLNIGAGMGSSTAYNVSIAAALLQYIRRCLLPHLGSPTKITKEGFKPFKYWSADLCKFEGRDLDLISRWGQFGDKIMHGNPSGIDNAVCTYGSVIEFRRGPSKPQITLIPNPKFLNILMVNTKIARSTRKLVGNVAALRDNWMSIVDPILQAMDSVALSAAETIRRLSRIAEDMKQEEALEELVSKEIGNLEELVDINQQLLKALGVSHDTLDHICRIAKMEGLHGKLTGAGGGGYAFILLPYKGYDHKVAAIRMNLDRHHFPVQQVSLGGRGVTLIETLDLREDYVPSGSIISEMIPDETLPSREIINPSVLTIPWKPVRTKRAEEEDLEEWPWPFDLRDVVKTMLENQIRKDVQCEEIAVPLKQLCAANVPEVLPKWMQEVDYFRKHIAPVWKNTLAKAQVHDWRKSNKDKSIRGKTTSQRVLDSTPNLILSYSQPVPWPPHTGRPRGVSSVIAAKRVLTGHVSSDASWPKLYSIHRASTKRFSVVSSHEPEVIGDKQYCMPKQSLQRSKLFPRERSPAVWLLNKFPPYGERKWTCDSAVEESARQQLDAINFTHKKFLRKQRAGCTMLEKLVSGAECQKLGRQ